MKRIILPALWIVSIVAACFATSLILKKARLEAIADAKSRIARGSISDADLTILYVDHGKGEEQVTLFEAMRDQARMRQLEKDYAQQSKVMDSAKTLIGTQADLIAGHEAAAQASAASYEAMKKSAELYKQAYEEKADVVIPSPSNYNTAGPAVMPANSASLTKAQVVEPNLPNWQLPSRNQAMAIIRKNAETEWGTNFNMVEHELENQTEAYEKLVQYHKQSWKPLMRTLLNKAAKEWGEDYRMMVHEIERQIEAKDRLEGGR